MSESEDRASGRHSPLEQRRIELDVRQEEINTSYPAIITAYNDETKRVSVQILPRRKHVKGEISYPVLDDVPWGGDTRAGNLRLGLDPKVGDQCAVFFAKREIESAKQSSVEYNLKYKRMHDISDGFAYPICFSGGPANVSLVECFLDLAEIVRSIAASDLATATQAAEAQALITKLRNVL